MKAAVVQLVAHVEGELQIQAVRIGVEYRTVDAIQVIAGRRFGETTSNGHRQRPTRCGQLRFDCRW